MSVRNAREPLHAELWRLADSMSYALCLDLQRRWPKDCNCLPFWLAKNTFGQIKKDGNNQLCSYLPAPATPYYGCFLTPEAERFPWDGRVPQSI